MNVRLFACVLASGLLSVVILCDVAYAPVSAQQSSATEGPGGYLNCGTSPDTIRACGEAWLKDCLKDWDAATHMSRQEYAQTCERVAKERVKALIDDAKSGNARLLGQ